MSQQEPSPGVPSEMAVTRSYVQQRIARLGFGPFSLVGYSVAGEETVVQSPELGICFDIGRCPQFALTSDVLCLSHGHMDHVAGLAYYASQRYFLGLKPPTILLPLDIADDVDEMLLAFRRLERQQTPYRLVPMAAGELYEIRKDLGVRTFSVHHGPSAMGFAVISIREKLKPEFHGKSAAELVQLKSEGVRIQYRLEVPLLAYMGDTTGGPAFSHPDVVHARVLVTECTFFELEHRGKAKAGRHLHVDELAGILPTLRNEYIVIGHVSRRTGVRRARSILRKAVGEEQARRVLFLMDFEDATDAGDASELAPPEAEE